MGVIVQKYEYPCLPEKATDPFHDRKCNHSK